MKFKDEIITINNFNIFFLFILISLTNKIKFSLLIFLQNFLNESLKYLDKMYPTNGGGMVSSSIDKNKMDNDKK